MSDCFRDSFPNGCCDGRFCAPPVVQKQIDNIIHVEKEIIRKDVPNGFVILNAGVQINGGSYTSPVLSIYTYRTSARKAKVAKGERSVIFDTSTTSQTTDSSRATSNVDVSATEAEVLIIPVEDLITISFKADVKKDKISDERSEMIEKRQWTRNCFDDCGETACGCCPCCSKPNVRVAPVRENTRIVVAADPNVSEDVIDEPQPIPVDDPCTDNIRCWCCRRKKLTSLIRRTHKKQAQAASRVLTITIDYSEFSHLDSASNVRLLKEEERFNFYKDNFNPKKQVKFHLVNTSELDPRKFEARTKEAELLCRTVLHLKGMKANYPSESDLDKMLQQVPRRTFGEIFTETDDPPPPKAKDKSSSVRVTTEPTSKSYTKDMYEED